MCRTSEDCTYCNMKDKEIKNLRQNVIELEENITNLKSELKVHEERVTYLKDNLAKEKRLRRGLDREMEDMKVPLSNRVIAMRLTMNQASLTRKHHCVKLTNQ